jgi:uncharacterized protein YdeI (YjbR/CyaY-like superfamily)
MARKGSAAGPLHSPPADLKEALAADRVAQAAWDDITPLARNEWICWISSAKQAKTRERRIAVGLDQLRKGTRRPCCWPGCPHRKG